ncbi:MAG: enterotoxin A family protein [Burkholderiaceae bacterium]|nr:enterotoxin A family protein [Burkholderiaceae bacterium]
MKDSLALQSLATPSRSQALHGFSDSAQGGAWRSCSEISKLIPRHADAWPRYFLPRAVQPGVQGSRYVGALEPGLAEKCVTDVRRIAPDSSQRVGFSARSTGRSDAASYAGDVPKGRIVHRLDTRSPDRILREGGFAPRGGVQGDTDMDRHRRRGLGETGETRGESGLISLTEEIKGTGMVERTLASTQGYPLHVYHVLADPNNTFRDDRDVFSPGDDVEHELFCTRVSLDQIVAVTILHSASEEETIGFPYSPYSRWTEEDMGGMKPRVPLVQLRKGPPWDDVT